MQTFLPYPSFERSVRVLDWKRLGKQRVEAMQILKALRDPTYGWQNHPAVNMWRGYETALAHYMNCCIDEWERRGYNNNMERECVDWYYVPPFVGKRKFHDSHKSNLLRKDRVWYSQFGWRVPNNLEYVWSV